MVPSRPKHLTARVKKPVMRSASASHHGFEGSEQKKGCGTDTVEWEPVAPVLTLSWRLTCGTASTVEAVCACAREVMLCCVVPSDASGCSAGAYDTGAAGPSAAADVPVHDT